MKKLSQNTIQILEAIYQLLGYDFSNYSASFIERRTTDWLINMHLETIDNPVSKIKSNLELATSFVKYMSIGVSEMFRNPSFFKSFRDIVIPKIHSKPFIKIWHAGCSTGEEVYAMAILLSEEGIYNRSRIYATDINNEFIDIAKKGIYTYDNIKKDTSNYVNAGGKEFFSKYYTSSYTSVIMNSALKERIVWANHNLVIDKVFNEMDVIVCRNVMIYFNDKLQEKTFQLFTESLSPGGLLCLGDKETLQFSSVRPQFKVLDNQNNIYQLKS